MKTLIVALGEQHDIKDAFNEVSDVIYWDWTKTQSVNSAIRYLTDEHKPDLLFMQIQTPNVINVETAKYIASKTKVINWTGDVRHPTPKWFIDIGRHIHLTLFSNMHDVDYLRQHGINADYLQVGFPDKIFTPKGEIKEGVPEIVFMGNNIGGFPLSSYRVDMVNKLKKRYGNRFGHYGINWGSNVKSITNQHEEATYYRGAKVAINLSHYNYGRYTSDRMLRIMGAGCFCLSHDYKDYGLEYEAGKHLAVWSNFTELFDKIDYYLDNEKERKLIAKEGCKHLHANHAWRNRVEQLIKMI